MRRVLDEILGAPTWEDFKESIYALHRQMFAATKNKFLEQIMASILDDRRAVLFDGRDTDKPAPSRCGSRPTGSSAPSSMRSPTATASEPRSWSLTI